MTGERAPRSPARCMIPKMPAPGLDPGVATGFRTKSCSNKGSRPSRIDRRIGRLDKAGARKVGQTLRGLLG